MPQNIFGEEDPETIEANKRAHDLLKRMNNVIEELHSRHGDGFNKFGSDETGVVRLLLIFDELMNSETWDGNGWAFISTAVNTVEKVSPIIQKPLASVLERRVPSDLESARLWIIYCLDTIDCMYLSLKAMWNLPEVIEAFYKKSSAIYASEVDFKTQFLNLIKKLHHPTGNGSKMEFNLDIGALSCYNTIFRSQVLKNQQPNHTHNQNMSDTVSTTTAAAIPSSTRSSGLARDESESNLDNMTPRTQQHYGSSSSHQHQHHDPSPAPTSTNLMAMGNEQHNNNASQITRQQSGNVAGAGAGGKKVIRRIVKKKGGATGGAGENITTTTTIVSGGNYDSNSMMMDDSSYPAEVTTPPPPSSSTQQHHQHQFGTPSANNNTSSVKKVNKENQTLSIETREYGAQVEIMINQNQNQNQQNSTTTAATATSSKSNASPTGGANNKRSFQELQEYDAALTQREQSVQEDERQVSEMREKLDREQHELELKSEELDEKLKKVATVADTLKELYIRLFNQTDSGTNSNKISVDDINEKIPLLVKVLNGENITTTATPTTTNDVSASSSVARAGSFSSRRPTLPTASTTSISNLNTVSNTSFSGTRPRAQTSAIGLNSTNTNTNNTNRMNSTTKRESSNLGGDDDNNINNDDNVTNQTRTSQAKSLPPTYGQQQQNTSTNNNTTKLGGTPDSSYHPSPAHSPPPRRSSMVDNNNIDSSSLSRANLDKQNKQQHSSLADNNDNDDDNQQQQQKLPSGLTNASFASTAIIRQTNQQNQQQAAKGIVCVAPDTCTTRPSQGIPYLIDPFHEVERNIQLKKQNNRCPKCQTDLVKNDASNPLLRSIVNMGQLAMAQKPRRCHYSGEIFCQKCHTNKTALIPHKVCGQWDFEEYHVSDHWYDYLGNNFERPIIHLPDVPLVMKKPVAQQLAQFRRKLNRMHAVLVLCPAIQKQQRNIFTTSYYFAREHWWSLADLVRMRLLEHDAPSSLSRGVPNADLLQHLGRLMSEALDHINSCPSCREKGYGICTLCHSASGGKTVSSMSSEGVLGQQHNNQQSNNVSSSPSLQNQQQQHQSPSGASSTGNKVAFWEDGAACDECGSIYHASCYELRGCPKCR